MKNFLRNPVDHIAVRFIILVIVDGRHNIIGVPQPVLIPCQIITEDRTVCPHGIAVISCLQFFALSINAAYIPRNLMVLRKLVILDLIGDFVRDDLPALATVIWNGIWIQITDILAMLLHVLECLLEKLVHQTHVGVFRVGSDSGKTAHGIGFTKNTCLHRVDCHLRNKIVIIKPSDHICLFHGWKFGTDNLTFLPSDGTQFLFCHLEHIA